MYSKLRTVFALRNIPSYQIRVHRTYSVANQLSVTANIPTVMKIKKAIRASECELEDLYSCFRTKCPVCPPNQASVKSVVKSTATATPTTTPQTKSNQVCRNDLYINKTTGDVICAACQHKFAFSSLEYFFLNSKKLNSADYINKKNSFLKSKPSIDSNKIPQDIIGDLKIIKNLSDTEIVQICEQLDVQNISIDQMKDALIHCDLENSTFYFPMVDANGSIVGYKKLSNQNGQLCETSFPEANCFGVVMHLPRKQQKNHRTAILVLNLLDYLSLIAANTIHTIICLPYGTKSLPQECLPLMEYYQKLILWFDHNTVGWDTARNFAKKLDEKRCYFVRPTDAHPTPYNAVQQSLNLKEILSSAKPIVHDAITTFRSLRNDVLSDLQNIDKVQGIKWKRFPSLNKMMKGHRRGELTLLTGPTGCGKTTFMAEYSLDLVMQGVSTLWGSFEIRNTRLATTLLRQMAGHPLDKDLTSFDRYAAEFEKFPMYFMTFHGQQNIKVVMEAVEHAQYVHDINHVIIDNLQFMMGTSGENRYLDRFWMQDEIIAALRTFATRRNCHVSLVIHPRKEREAEDLTTSSIFGGAKATQEADNVLIIQDKRLTNIKGKKYLQVAKNRYSGDLGIMVLDFNKEGLSYAEKTKRKSKDEME